MSANPLYSSAAWRKLSAQRKAMAREHDEHCCRCHRPIDYDLDSRHKMGCTIDHLTNPIGLGGDQLPPLADLGPAHRTCNSRHGGRLGQQLKRGTATTSQPRPEVTNRSRTEVKPTRGPNFLETRNSPSTGDLFHPGALDGAEAELELPPRVFTPRHPNAVGSLGPAWVAWAEANIRPAKTRRPLRLRPWQRYVLERALEVDSAGELCWRTVAVSTGRQLGKSWIMIALALARMAHAERFEEQQRIVHTAAKLRQAWRIHSQVWPWAESSGYHVSRAVDSAAVTAPEDGSAWLISSLAAVWGETATTVFADELWNVEPQVIEDGIEPTLLDPVQSQLWAFSAANEAATITYPRLRVRGTARGVGDGRTLVLEWSAPAGADRLDPAVHRASQPYWTRQRAEFMAAKSRQRGFSTEYLNIWPNLIEGESVEESWPKGWGGRRGDLGSPAAGLLGAVEVSLDKRSYGVAVAELVDGRPRVWTRTVGSVEDAVRQLRQWAPAVVLCGVTLERDLVGAWRLETVGTKETGWATPDVAKWVAEGVLTHDGDAGIVDEVSWAKATMTAGGPVLSAARSDGPIPTVKAMSWAVWGVVDGRFRPVEAQIW